MHETRDWADNKEAPTTAIWSEMIWDGGRACIVYMSEKMAYKKW